MRTQLVIGSLIAFVGVATGVAAPPENGFTYQGQLKKGGEPVSGNYDMEFRLFNRDTGGNQVNRPVMLNGVEVSNGLFTAKLNADGEFGLDAFDGQQLWLEITVVGITLDPRQPVTPVPYAIHAINAPDGHSLDAADGDPIDAVYVDNLGNVGVGTTTPSQKLDVSGNIHASGTIASGNSITIDGTANTINSSGILGLQTVSGNVGIGTTAPAQRLDVVAASDGDGIRVIGTQDASPGFELLASWCEGCPQANFIKTYTGALGLATSAGDWSADAQPGDVVLRSLGRQNNVVLDLPTRLILQNGDGPAGLVLRENNVGIGTPTPARRLDVSGAVRTTTLEITGGSPLQQDSLVGWGNNDYDQINVPSGTFTAVAASWYHSLGLKADRSIVAWGCIGADYGQCNVPAPNADFIGVSAGQLYSLAIRSNGTLAAWGYDFHGSGLLNVSLGTFTAVAAGRFHSLAIRSNGTLVGWGSNANGEINVPAGTFTAVAAGDYFSLAIASNGTLVGWGYNGQGQINPLPSGTFTAVAAGGAHSLAIASNGTLVGWGYPGDGATTVPAGTFTAVAAGWKQSLAIASNGTLVGWGDNGQGQINPLPSGTFTAVTAGQYHSLAIATDPPSFALLLANDSAAKPGSNTWTISSDRRLKKNIEPLSGALERLLQLSGVTFQWLDPASQGGITGTQMGLIADEVQRAFPQWVGRDPKGYQTLTVGGFEALTAEALRELRVEKDAQIATLRKLQAEKDAEIADVKGRLARMERVVEELLSEQEGKKP